MAETNGRTMCNGDVINGSLESAGSSRGNSSCGSIDVDDVFQTSPAGQPLGRPASPTIRDFTEKNDSVSYVLDIGDRSPSASPLGPPPALFPWPIRRNNLVRSASLRYPARHPHWEKFITFRMVPNLRTKFKQFWQLPPKLTHYIFECHVVFIISMTSQIKIVDDSSPSVIFIISTYVVLVKGIRWFFFTLCVCVCCFFFHPLIYFTPKYNFVLVLLSLLLYIHKPLYIFFIFV